MPLTVQQNGSVVGGQPNVVQASWFNDYHDLMTGVMVDQDVTLKTNSVVRSIVGPPTAPTLTLQAGTALGVGAYSYAVTFTKSGVAGETALGTIASVTTTTNNQQVGLSAIPTSSSIAVTGRKLYRTKVGGSVYYLLATIADNTTTVYTDTVADTSLTVASPVADSLGALLIEDHTGSVKGQWNNDGSLQATTLSGTLAITPNANGLTAQDSGATIDLKPNGGATSRGMTLQYRDSGGSPHAVVTISSTGVLQFTPGTTSTIGFSVKDNGNGQVEFDSFAPNGTARGMILAGLDATGTLHQGVLVNPTGIVSLGFNRNGAVSNGGIYTGTTTPTGDGVSTPATGAIWVKA